MSSLILWKLWALFFNSEQTALVEKSLDVQLNITPSNRRFFAGAVTNTELGLSKMCGIATLISFRAMGCSRCAVRTIPYGKTQNMSKRAELGRPPVWRMDVNKSPCVYIYQLLTTLFTQAYL